MMYFGSMVSLIPQMASWTLLLAFCYWAYRQFNLKSLSWLAAYIFVTPLLAVAFKFLIQRFINSPLAQNMHVGFGFSNVMGAHIFFSELALLLLIILILSDVITLLSKLGHDIHSSFWAKGLLLHERSTALGLGVLALQALPVVSLFLYIFVYLEFV